MVTVSPTVPLVVIFTSAMALLTPATNRAQRLRTAIETRSDFMLIAPLFVIIIVLKNWICFCFYVAPGTRCCLLG
jgi:hypothetical protein